MVCFSLLLSIHAQALSFPSILKIPHDRFIKQGALSQHFALLLADEIFHLASVQLVLVPDRSCELVLYQSYFYWIRLMAFQSSISRHLLPTTPLSSIQIFFLWPAWHLWEAKHPQDVDLDQSAKRRLQCSLLGFFYVADHPPGQHHLNPCRWADCGTTWSLSFHFSNTFFPWRIVRGVLSSLLSLITYIICFSCRSICSFFFA